MVQPVYKHLTMGASKCIKRMNRSGTGYSTGAKGLKIEKGVCSTRLR